MFAIGHRPLDQYVEQVAVLSYCSPEVTLLAVEFDGHFVQVPFISG
jgi:hypothetical protein